MRKNNGVRNSWRSTEADGSWGTWDSRDSDYFNLEEEHVHPSYFCEICHPSSFYGSNILHIHVHNPITLCADYSFGNDPFSWEVFLWLAVPICFSF